MQVWMWFFFFSLNLYAVVSEYIHSFLVTAINLGKHLFFLMLLTDGDLYICCCLPSPSSHVLIIHITTLQYYPFTCFKSLSEMRTISDLASCQKISSPQLLLNANNGSRGCLHLKLSSTSQNIWTFLIIIL